MDLPTIDYDPKNPFMFRGTEKKLNYYLIAQNGPVILGVRILAYQISKTKAHVGFRIRCQAHPDYQGNVDPSAFTMTWPNINWEKADNVRASRVMVQEVEMQPGQWDQLEDAVKKARMIGKLMALLGSACQVDELPYEQEDLSDILMSEVQKQMGSHVAQGNHGIEGEVSADKHAPMLTGMEAQKKATKDAIMEQGAEHFQQQGEEMPEDFEQQVDNNISKMFGDAEQTPGEGAVADGDPVLASFFNDDDDDSGLLPN